jgi:hypothetical protein
MGKAPSIWLLAVICMLAPVPALAQGTITAVAVTPSPAVPGQTVTISVDVVGTCNGQGLTLSYGDFGIPETFTFPLPPITHTYGEPGTYGLTANPSFPNLPNLPPVCGGGATTLLPVLPASTLTGVAGGLYCAIFGCHPTITSIPLPSIIKPGGVVIFQGNDFGLETGTAWIILQSFGGNWPETRTQLQIVAGDWHPGVVIATIPTISGVLTQTATFQIITKGSSASNAIHSGFAATRHLLDIPASRIGCSMTTNSPSDSCQNIGGTNYPAECGLGIYGTAPPVEGFAGLHSSGWQWLPGNNDTGLDTFGLTSPLQNGWLSAGADFAYSSTDNGSGAYILSPPGFDFGTPTANPSNWTIGWYVDACGQLGYAGDFEIVGPMGVPY